MADGKVVIQVEMDGNKAQSGVSKLKSLLGGLSESGAKLGSVFKSVLGANLVSSAITSGIGMVGSGIREMVGELNSSQKAWKTFEGNLQAFGRSSDEIRKAKTEMQDFATKTIYSASDMASTYSQLDAVGTKNVGSLVKAFGGLAASAENPAQAMKSLSTQATQMASKPKVAWMDFKIMMEQAPAGMAAVAKEMGMSTAELVSAVQDGKIKTEDFFDAMNRAGNSDAFQKMATEFKTVDQAIDGAKESLSNKLMPAFEKLNAFGIKAVNALSNALEKINFGKLADGLGKFLESIDVEKIVAKVSSTISNLAGKVKAFWTAFSNTGAVSAFISAIQSIAGAIGHIWNSLTASNELNTLASVLGNVVKWLSQAATVAANFISSLPAGAIQAIVGGLVGLVAGFKTFNFLKSFNPFNIFKRNATEAASGAAEAITQGRSKIAQILGSLSSVIGSIGGAVKSAAIGIGIGIKAALSGVSQVILAFGAALQTAGVANILAFGGAVATAAVGIGAGVAIIAAGFALLATQGQGVATIINAVGDAFATVATAIIGAFAQAIVTVAGVLPIVTSALANLAPLIVAFGQAFGAAAPFVSALGEAITSIASVLPPVISAFSQGVAAIVEAVTPIVEIIGNVFTTVAQIVADAIVQIVQALAPFMPAVVEIAQALAPVLQSIAEAFTALVAQISPIIDSIANLFRTLGNVIKSVLDGAKGVIEGFGNAVRTILDGISGIFDSIGRAALSAGQGFKLLAQGVVMITNTNLGDMAASLGAVALGVGNIASKSAGLAQAGNAMKTLGVGMTTVSSQANAAVSGLTNFATRITSVQTAVTALPSILASAASSFASFVGQVVSGIAGLSAINAPIAALRTQVTTITPALLQAAMGFTVFGAQVIAINSSLTIVSATFVQVGTSAASASGQITAISASTASAIAAFASMSAQVQSSMQMMLAVVRSTGSQMISQGRQTGQQTSQNIAQGIRGGGGQVRSAMSSLVNAARSVGMSGAATMRYVGAMIGQGLAQGMYSALGAVTAAANALVAQAERAAQAKARIHSPSRLFRDNVGRYISQGMAVGILADAHKVDDAMGDVYDQIRAFKYAPEDIIGVGQAQLSRTVQVKSDLERSIKASVKVVQEKSNNLVERALEVAERAVRRPVNMVLDDGALVAKIGKPMTDYQNDKLLLDNMMRGIT
ncbi:tape measure protein [Streptococcus cristatus]|uniref:tape measure protein n=1 Tax=Streptococcus cristatus TaxID=45634 RepID=UPI0028E63593|nr:tape measure protein [Streptococcus cristatus]